MSVLDWGWKSDSGSDWSNWGDSGLGVSALVQRRIGQGWDKGSELKGVTHLRCNPLESAMDLASGDQIRLALLEGSIHDLGTHYLF